jgi:hypothetical protein
MGIGITNNRHCGFDQPPIPVGERIWPGGWKKKLSVEKKRSCGADETRFRRNQEGN